MLTVRDDGPKAWFVLAIPTVPRKGDKHYLLHTLEFIQEQLPSDPAHPHFGRVLVLVMNNERTAPHADFDQARRLYQGNVYVHHAG